jgi:HlyD family secretion protein
LSFDPLRHHPRLRKISPWIVYGGVLVTVAVLAPGIGSVGVVAAQAEVRQANVIAPRTARVTRVAVRPGDNVQAGDVLVELDPAGVDLELAVAKAELRTLQVKTVADALDLRGSDLESSARLAQEAERAAVDLAALVSEEKRDRAELEQLDKLIEKQEQLVAQRLASNQQRDELVLQRSSVAQRVAEYGSLLKAARDHERSARERLKAWRDAKEKGTTADDVQHGRAPAHAPAGSPAEAEVLAQGERVKALEALRAQLVVRAPIAGLVADVFVTDGDTARADATIVVLVDDHPLRVVAWVDQQAAHRVQIGTKVTLRPSDRSGGERTGVVRGLAPSIAELPVRFRVVPTQPSFGRAVYIALDQPAGVAPPLPGQAFDVVFGGGS